MEITKLSSKGQVIIPKTFRTAHRWEAGLELIAIDTGDGILLKPKVPFEESSLDDVAGCLPSEGNARSLEDMEQRIRDQVRKEWRDRG